MGINTAKYEKFQTYFYGFLWVFIVIGCVTNYMLYGEPNPWAIPVLVLGLIMFLVAKISVLRAGHRLTFGASAAEHMNLRMKWSYYGGYIIMFAGFLLSFKYW